MFNKLIVKTKSEWYMGVYTKLMRIFFDIPVQFYTKANGDVVEIIEYADFEKAVSKVKKVLIKKDSDYEKSGYVIKYINGNEIKDYQNSDLLIPVYVVSYPFKVEELIDGEIGIVGNERIIVKKEDSSHEISR